MKRAIVRIGVALLLADPGSARAADAWVDRPITLPRGTFAFDVGLGVGTAPRNDLVATSYTGAALNLEASWGILETFEVGLRTAARLDFDGRLLRADYYARTYDLETYGTRIGNPANPEARARFAFLRLPPVEVAGEVRIYLPIESGSHEGVMFGVPVAVHLDHRVRIDGGVYFPILLYNPVITAVSLPAHVWFQATEHVWAGPLLGVTFMRGAEQIGHPSDEVLFWVMGMRQFTLFWRRAVYRMHQSR